MLSPMKIAATSLLVGLLVLALKSFAWWTTGSVALLSDALESIVNLATALAALIAIKIAALPADENHPFGHHKAEYFSAVLEGVLIIIAAFFILREAYVGFFDPQPIAAPLEGLVVNGVATLINGGWAWVLVRQGQKLRSPALVADGKHLWSDVISSMGIVTGVLVAWGTDLWVLDAVLAAVVAVHILISGSRVIIGSLNGLMDESVPKPVLVTIRQIISDHADGAVEAHDLKTRQAASIVFIEFHLVVPGDMTVFDSHEICDRIERALEDEIADVQVTIHVEPEHKSKHSGIVILD
ncbi:MAG: cation transporter [Pelagimonas sp.]